MGSIGDCFDNSVAESFFGTLQLELLDEHRWATRQHLALVVRSRNGARFVESDSAASDLGDDLVGGLVPDVGLGVVVPAFDPGADRLYYIKY